MVSAMHLKLLDLIKDALRLLTTCPTVQNTRSLAALVLITQNLFLAKLLRAGNFILWSRQQWRMLLHLCTASSLYFSCSCHPQMHWVNIQGSTQRISYPARDLPYTKFNPHPFDKCGCTEPAQLKPPCAGH